MLKKEQTNTVVFENKYGYEIQKSRDSLVYQALQDEQEQNKIEL